MCTTLSRIHRKGLFGKTYQNIAMVCVDVSRTPEMTVWKPFGKLMSRLSNYAMLIETLLQPLIWKSNLIKSHPKHYTHLVQVKLLLVSSCLLLKMDEGICCWYFPSGQKSQKFQFVVDYMKTKQYGEENNHQKHPECSNDWLWLQCIIFNDRWLSRLNTLAEKWQITINCTYRVYQQMIHS